MIQDQPPPIAQPQRPAVWSLVIDDVRRMFDGSEGRPPRGHSTDVAKLVLEDMAERDRIGRERYGVPLTTHNGRDHLVDAYQEMLDGAVYLRAEIEEKGANYVQLGTHSIYHEHLLNVSRLRHMIWERDGR